MARYWHPKIQASVHMQMRFMTVSTTGWLVMGKFASLRANIKSKFSLPKDNRGIRVTLMILSVLLLIAAIAGILLLLLLSYLVIEPGDFDEGSSAVMFMIALTMFSVFAVALILCLVPSYFGYHAAHDNTHIKKCQIIGIAWCVLGVPYPCIELVQTFQDPFGVSIEEVLFHFIFLIVPILWLSLIVRLSLCMRRYGQVKRGSADYRC